MFVSHVTCTARVAFVVVLMATIAVLAPIAYASPPDQTWLAGIYDDGDFDDVVVLIASSVGLADTPPPTDGGLSLPSIVLAPNPDDRPCIVVLVAVEQTRAPPLS
jgi:hypothetical protein